MPIAVLYGPNGRIHFAKPVPAIDVWVSIAAMDHKSCDAVFVDLSTLEERFAVLRSGEAQGGYSL